MNEFDKTTRNLIITLLCMFLILLAFGFVFRDTHFLNGAFGEVTFFVYAFGLVFGIAFSIIKVLLIRLSLVKVLSKSKNRATMSSLGHFLFRYFLTGLVLFISLKSDKLDFFATTLGVLSLQPASYFSGFLLKRNKEVKQEFLEAEKELDL